MNKAIEDINILLIQVREREDTRRQEHECFAKQCGVRLEQITAVNLVDTPVIPADVVERADVVMIGGAGVFSATEDYDHTRPTIELIRKLQDQGKPLFGSCWGHQIIARALDGEVVHDPERGEAGSHDMHLTDAGRANPLFSYMPATFVGQCGHNDRVSQLPPGGIELVRNEMCPNQAFTIAGKPIYGTQFHSELSVDDLVWRLSIYRDIYVDAGLDFDDFIASLRPTPETDRLLRRFLSQLFD